MGPGRDDKVDYVEDEVGREEWVKGRGRHFVLKPAMLRWGASGA